MAKLVNHLVRHDIVEKKLIKLADDRGCKPSELTAEEKSEHDVLEWETLDCFAQMTKEEKSLAIDIYDGLHDFIELI